MVPGHPPARHGGFLNGGADRDQTVDLLNAIYIQTSLVFHPITDDA
jgi:hypothetical protein